jgi:predicted TPR repeat methyltransferase
LNVARKLKKRRPAPRKKSAKKGDQELNLEEALELAIQVHRGGMATRNAEMLEGARTLYERVLAVQPENPKALHFLGVLWHQRGDTAQATELIRRSIEAAPTCADYHNNFGNVLRECERIDEATEAYRQAIALEPEHADALNNLGNILKAKGASDEAIEMYERVIALEPSHAVAHQNLGNALERVGRRDEAIAHFRKAIALDPNHPDARKILALALFYSGHEAAAIEVVEQWIGLEPENPVAAHMLAAFSGADVPTRASDAYLERAFDTMSTNFDEHLRELGYRAPELVADAIAAHLGAPAATLDILDAGCGTGLCGPLLRPYARSLVGVDLSKGMLERARKLRVYDELFQGELTAFLASREEPADLLVLADTFCYFGALEEAFEAAARALAPAGLMVFTVEKNVETDEAHRLNPHGRYSHTEGYVRAVAEGAGFTLVGLEVETIRHERNEPVAGLVVVCRR